MSSKLLEEAIVDAQKLRELAEQTAKNKIVEAVMPQIREMVNRRILGESLETEGYSSQDESENFKEQDEADESDLDESLAEALAKLVFEREKDVEETDESEEAEEEDKKSKNASALQELHHLEESVRKLQRVISLDQYIVDANVSRIAQKITECAERAMKLQQKLTLSENTTNGSLNRRLVKSIKELRTMARKNRNIFDFLFQEGGNRRLSEASLNIEFDEDEKERLGDSYDELSQILSAAGIQVAGAESEEEESDMEDMEDMEDEGEFEEEETEEEPEEEEEEEMEESWGGRRESSRQRYSEYDEIDEVDEYDEVDEIDEYAEVDEVDEMEYKNERARHMESRMRRRRMRESAAVDKASHFGGAKVLGDVILDLDEEDLINVLADELGKYDGVKEPRVRAESRSYGARNARSERRLQESLRSAQGEASRYKRAAKQLQNQLQEMNLFNAKLLYANKLMQNKELNMKQQRAIVEALDNAKTLREAKLLFESLSESLGRKASAKSSPLREGLVRPAGSASRSTRSAAPANASGVDSDRWAILAGIGK